MGVVNLFLCVYILSLEIKLSRGDGRDPMERLSPVIFCAFPKSVCVLSELR